MCYLGGRKRRTVFSIGVYAANRPIADIALPLDGLADRRFSMLRTGDLLPWSFGVFSLFAVLAGLALLVGADHASPGCTGPEVQRCDYVASAKAAVARSEHHLFQTDLSFEIFDQGSAVLVQQFTPPGEPSLNHAPSVLVAKRSCRACGVDGHFPTRGDPLAPYVGRLVRRVPAEDAEAAAERSERWKDGPGGASFL